VDRLAQDHRQPVPYTAACTVIRDHGQRRQQPRRFLVQGRRGGQQLVNRSANQG